MRMDDVTDGSNIDAIISRSFSAPVGTVFNQWTSVDGLRAWFAPDGFMVTFCETSAAVGGSWQVELRSEDGEVYLEYGEYREISRPDRLVFTLTQAHNAEIGPRTTVTVDFSDKASHTEIAFLQEGFESVERRDDNVEGWNECFNKLEASLASD
ncbi:MAG: polyketide cyclase [Rhizobium sp.]|nr:polyketide cyclase [Rhizobium sp.]